MSGAPDGYRVGAAPTPRWWAWTMAAAVAFAVSYATYFHVGVGRSVVEAHAADAAAHDERLASLGVVGTDDATIARLAADDEWMESIAPVFAAHCSRCHGPAGRGGAGPSLTDDAALHADTPAAIARAIRDGVAGTDMPAWGGRLRETQITLLAAYVASLRGTSAAAPAATRPPACPRIVAHRGASADAPENTLAAFELAWQQGADAVEGDFHLSKDGIVVCHHDPSTEKTAGVDRPVSEQTLDELRAHDVGAWKGPAWTGTRMPTLDDVLTTVPPDKSILIELKAGVEIVPPLVRVLAASALDPAQVTVIAFSADVVAAVKQARPDLRALWLTSIKVDVLGDVTPTVGEIITTARACGADGVDVKAELRVVDEAFAAAVRGAGLELHVWTVNEAAAARRLADLGVDSITTDRPGWLRPHTCSSP